MIWQDLWEDVFFFLDQKNISPEDTLSWPINIRKWLIHRSIEQREKEQNAIEAAKKKK
jgi:hypothetical protein